MSERFSNTTLKFPRTSSEAFRGADYASAIERMDRSPFWAFKGIGFKGWAILAVIAGLLAWCAA